MNDPSDGFALEEISRARNADMLRILEESPIETRGLTIAFDRAPDIFAIPELFADRVACVGFLKGGELFGFAMLSVQDRYVNGEPRPVSYYGSAHARAEGRGHGFLFRVSDRLFQGHDEGAEIGYAVVMTGNEAAERFIGRRMSAYPNLPYSRVIASLSASNILVLARKKESGTIRVRGAAPADVDIMVSLLQEEFRQRLFAPVIDRETFIENAARRPGCAISDHYVAEKDGRIVGTCAAWDMGRLQRTRIIRYGPKLKLARRGHAILARLAGLPPWPEEGDAIKSVTITDCAVRNRDPEILEALLLRVYNDSRERKFHMLTVGSCRQDPLLRATRRFISFRVLSKIVLLAKDPSVLAEGRLDASLPYVDLAML
jgi:hypothetical protein